MICSGFLSLTKRLFSIVKLQSDCSTGPADCSAAQKVMTNEAASTLHGKARVLMPNIFPDDPIRAGATSLTIPYNLNNGSFAML